MGEEIRTIWKLFLSMSCSGALLFLILLFGKRIWRNKISRQWQYYIWLAVVLRLLLPFGMEISLLGKAYQTMDQAESRWMRETVEKPMKNQTQHQEQNQAQDQTMGQQSEGYSSQQTDSLMSPKNSSEAVIVSSERISLLVKYIGLFWLAVALGILIRKITIYQSFLQYIRAGLTPVSDVKLLNQLSMAAEQIGVKRPVELGTNPLISSPLLIGFLHPCIVLPDTAASEQELLYIMLHELMHYKRRDVCYKWLVQVTLCLHWFNPLVFVLSREITKDCEFSCDEAVLLKTGLENAQGYGETLLAAMKAVRRYREAPGTLTLNGSKQLLKERLDAIMNLRKRTKTIRFMTGILTICVILGACLVGVYPVDAANSSVHIVLGADTAKTISAARAVTIDSFFDSKTERAPLSNRKPIKEDFQDEKEVLLEEYAAYGITKSENNGCYCYQGKSVNILLDRRRNNTGTSYTLGMNPEGEVNIKILRDDAGKIKRVKYMTETEVEIFLNCMEETNGKPDKRIAEMLNDTEESDEGK